MNTSYSYGRFNDIAGQFALDDKDPKKSHLDIVVKTESIDTANANRDKHLSGPDFFNAVQYPTIAFKSKSVAKAGADTYQVQGDLTLHGDQPTDLDGHPHRGGQGHEGQAGCGLRDRIRDQAVGVQDEQNA